MNISKYSFSKAVPVWKKGDSSVMNQTIELVSEISVKSAALRITGSTLYEVFVNGKLCAFGPARAAHGYYKCDEIQLDKWLTKDVNTVTLRVCGYNVNSYVWLDQPSFMCAEIVNNGEIIAYTCEKCVNFDAFIYNERVQKIQRYSFQRAFAEGYRLGMGEPRTAIELEECEPKTFICRDVPYGEYEDLLPCAVTGRGSVVFEDKESYLTHGFLENIDGVQRKGYAENELEYASCIDYERAVYSAHKETNENAKEIVLPKDSYADVVFEANRAGIISFELEADGDGTLFLSYDERIIERAIDPLSHGRTSVVSAEVKAGKYTVITAEPYVFKYARLTARGASFKIIGLKQIAVSYPASLISSEFTGDDEAMKLIYDSAINTFRDNTVDVYMDCPSRERADWLCDSFFTARVENVLTGRCDVERAFLYNFLYHETDKYLPNGMFPMCYPSEHYNANYIPNWAMWYVIELYEYAQRSGDTEILDDAKNRMYALLDFFAKYENSDGLLEKLDAWVFIDWSEANKLVQDVSYASNMMYAYCIETVGKMYGDASLTEKAEKIRITVREQSMTESGFFCDNAVRNANGELELSGKCTEACQYYAFFTGVATPELYPELWNKLVNEFGFDRVQKGLYPEIYPANAFIANYIRLELLCRSGEHKVLYDNIKGYFTYMAERTGTLWENNHNRSSLNHGFASHVIYWMEKLGLVKRA